MHDPVPEKSEFETAPRVAVAMSGGADSSVAAALLVEQGYEVVGLTARMWKDGSRCCSLEDVERARKVCWKLGIRHVVVNALDAFSRCVAERFAADYIRGRTPSPCVVCNELVKFGLLLDRAIQFGCDRLATGHYARIICKDGLYALERARDRTRDQSYFLHRLSQLQLARILFPLADLLKQEDVLPYARRQELPLTSRGESQDICFAPKGRHHEVVEAFFPSAPRSGPICDITGKRLGTHEGIHRYTIGQRKGLGLTTGAPLYVTRISAVDDTIEVGTRQEAMTQTCLVEDLHWIAGHSPNVGRTYDVRTRYRHPPAPAHFAPLGDGRVRVKFEEPQFAVAPGQAAVFYDGDTVLGGGWIGPGA
jgi:tRNA-specific 2-thiouridylase